MKPKIDIFIKDKLDERGFSQSENDWKDTLSLLEKYDAVE